MSVPNTETKPLGGRLLIFLKDLYDVILLTIPILVFGCILLLFCIFLYHCITFNTVDTFKYYACEHGGTEVVSDISKLEGNLNAILRMIPVFSSLLIVIILFLTWNQIGIAKNTAKEEFESSFKSYKDKVTKLTKEIENIKQVAESEVKTIVKLSYHLQGASEARQELKKPIDNDLS